jgi:NosR/NirI family nitrous oxide reductase transcriptional regulator
LPEMFFKKVCREQHKRVITTLVVGLTFLYFWIEGPLQGKNAVINLERGETEFLSPKLIPDKLAGEQNKFGLIKDDQLLSQNQYFGLTGKERKIKTFSIIADQHNNPAMIKKVGEDMLEHAKIFQLLTKLKISTAVDMFYIEIRSEQNIFEGIYLESTGLTEQIKGYAGPITMGLIISPRGEIISANYVSSEETSSYLNQIEQAHFYKQFEKITLDGSSYKLDAVSGATLTTKAIARTVSLLLEKASESPLELYLDNDPAGTKIEAQLSRRWIVHAVAIFLIFLFFWQSKYRRSRNQINVMLIISIFYIGFYLNNSFTYISFSHPFMGVSVSYLVGFYSAFILLGAIWDNNTYCKFICPYGNVQRLITRLFPAKRRVFFIPAVWVKRIRLLLTLVIFSGVILGLRSWSSYELFPDLFGFELINLWFWLALSMVLLAIYYPMLWCRLLCPTGEILDRISTTVQPGRTNSQPNNKILIREL